jgi:hypothetical protein
MNFSFKVGDEITFKSAMMKSDFLRLEANQYIYEHCFDYDIAEVVLVEDGRLYLKTREVGSSSIHENEYHMFSTVKPTPYTKVDEPDLSSISTLEKRLKLDNIINQIDIIRNLEIDDCPADIKSQLIKLFSIAYDSEPNYKGIEYCHALKLRWSRDPSLVLLTKLGLGQWRKSVNQSSITNFDDCIYFLVCKRHVNVALHWLNGGRIEYMVGGTWVECNPSEFPEYIEYRKL